MTDHADKSQYATVNTRENWLSVAACVLLVAIEFFNR